MTSSFRGVAARNLGEKLRKISRRKKNGLRKLTRKLAEFSPRKFAFENFCSRSEREKRAFFLGWSVDLSSISNVEPKVVMCCLI